jgi:hypothetical protein
MRFAKPQPRTLKMPHRRDVAVPVRLRRSVAAALPHSFLSWLGTVQQHAERVPDRLRSEARRRAVHIRHVALRAATRPNDAGRLGLRWVLCTFGSLSFSAARRAERSARGEILEFPAIPCMDAREGNLSKFLDERRFRAEPDQLGDSKSLLLGHCEPNRSVVNEAGPLSSRHCGGRTEGLVPPNRVGEVIGASSAGTYGEQQVRADLAHPVFPFLSQRFRCSAP